MMEHRRVAVIGAGLAGLAAAFQLRRAGVSVDLFEAADRPGGVVRTVREGGWLAEEGPNSLAAPPSSVAALLGDAGLRPSICPASAEARRRYVVRGGRVRALPASPPALLASSFFSPRARLRLLAEPFAPAAPAGVDESVAKMVRRRLGPEVLAYAVDPFISGIYAGDPEHLSVRHALPRLAALEAEHGSLLRGAMRMASNRPKGDDPDALPPIFSFREGVGQIAAALADDLGRALHTSTPVTAVHREAGAWWVEAGGAGERFDAVVYAGPAHRADSLAWDAGNEASIRTIAAIPHAPVAVLALGFRRGDVVHPLDGFGMLCPAAEHRTILGTLFTSTLFPGRAPAGHVLLTTFLGGTRAPDAADLPVAWLRTRVIEELRSLLGARGAPVFEHLAVWRQAIPQPVVGHGRVVREMESLERRNPGLVLAGSWRAGVSVGDTLASGLRAADQAAAHLATLPVSALSG